MIRARLALAIVVLFGSVALAHADGLEQTHQTVPSASFSFMSDLQTFLKREDANRLADLSSNAVISGGIHSTAAGLVGSPSSLTAYLAGYYVTEDATITYPDASTCWVIAHTTMTGNQGSFTRVSNTHYLINCGSTPQPALPDSSSVYLMQVTTSGGAITAVTDLRPYGGSIGFDLCKYSKLSTALTALGTRQAHLLLTCSLPVDANASIPTTAHILPSRSGRFAVESGVTIAMDSPSQISPGTVWPLFTGASTAPVSFTNPGDVRPEWWNAGCSVSASLNTTYIKRAIDSLPSGGKLGWVKFQSCTYQHDNSLPTNSRNVGFVGAGSDSTTLTLTTASSARHGFYCTGTTQHIRVVGITFAASPAHTADNAQSAVRCDADSDAPSLTTAATVILSDLKCDGYNICAYADGGSSFKITQFLFDRITAWIGGSGSTSGVNEGVNCLRTLECAGIHLTIFGQDTADHGLYALGNLTVNIHQVYIEQTLNEAVKLIPVSGVASLTDPYHWTVANATYVDNGGSINLSIDQDYILDKADFSNTTIITDGGSGSTAAAIMLQASSTAQIRNIDLHGLTARGLQKSVVNISGSSTGKIDFINATDWSIYDWSLATDDTYSVFAVNRLNSAVFGTLIYSGQFDGATHGRSVFVPGGRDEFSLVQPLAIVESNTSVPETHYLVSRMGTSISEKVNLGGTIYCKTLNTTTTAVTTEETLAAYTLQAGALNSDVSGADNTSGIRVSAWGKFAANANTKTVRLYISSDVIKSNSVTTAPNNVDWWMEAEYRRYASTTETAIARMEVGAVSQGTTKSALSHNLANSLTVALKGQNGTALADEIHLSGFCLYGLPN